MQLHEISHPNKSAKRIGRGGKRGTTSGRGQKGQKSRAGHKIRPAIRDFIQRLPKLRGFANNPTSPEVMTFNVGELGKAAAGREQIDVAVLKEIGLVPQRFRGPVKVLGNGAAKGAFRLVGIQASEGARAKIEQAGGSLA